ncbi:hypothetical protein V8C35DRAFT_139535 [Trichoderma chlorosporum]
MPSNGHHLGKVLWRSYGYLGVNKIGTSPQVSVSDTIPIRQPSKNPDWESDFGKVKWIKMEELSVNFNYQILRAAPIVLFVGQSSLNYFKKKLQDDPSIKLKKISLGFVETKIFTKKPFFYIVYQENEIQQLVFFCNHSSRFLFGRYLKEAIYSDFIWNTAASLAQIEVLSLDLLTRFAITTRLSTEGWANLTEKDKKQKLRESQINPAIEANRATNFANLQAARNARTTLNLGQALRAVHEARRRRLRSHGRLCKRTIFVKLL